MVRKEIAIFDIQKTNKNIKTMANNRFESTVANFRDCLRNLERIVNEGEAVTQREWDCARAMYIYARDFVETYEEQGHINIEK